MKLVVLRDETFKKKNQLEAVSELRPCFYIFYVDLNRPEPAAHCHRSLVDNISFLGYRRWRDMPGLAFTTML